MALCGSSLPTSLAPTTSAVGDSEGPGKDGGGCGSREGPATPPAEARRAERATPDSPPRLPSSSFCHPTGGKCQVDGILLPRSPSRGQLRGGPRRPPGTLKDPDEVIDNFEGPDDGTSTLASVSDPGHALSTAPPSGPSGPRESFARSSAPPTGFPLLDGAPSISGGGRGGGGRLGRPNLSRKACYSGLVESYRSKQMAAALALANEERKGWVPTHTPSGQECVSVATATGAPHATVTAARGSLASKLPMPSSLSSFPSSHPSSYNGAGSCSDVGDYSNGRWQDSGDGCARQLISGAASGGGGGQQKVPCPSVRTSAGAATATAATFTVIAAVAAGAGVDRVSAASAGLDEEMIELMAWLRISGGGGGGGEAMDQQGQPAPVCRLNPRKSGSMASTATAADRQGRQEGGRTSWWMLLLAGSGGGGRGC